MYHQVIGFHIAISIGFIIIAFYILSRSFIRSHKNMDFNMFDRYLTLGYLIFMYLQLISGFSLYFFIRPSENEHLLTLAQVNRNNALRFWVTEHIAMMFFALALSQIGYLFIKNTTGNKRKYRHIIFYYGISTIVILISTGIAISRETNY